MKRIIKICLCFLMVFGLLSIPSNVSSEEVIELSCSQMTLLLDDNASLLDESDLMATLNIDEDATIIWSLSEEGIVELTEDTNHSVEIIALAEGEVEVIASLTDSNGNTYSDSCYVSVVTVDSSLDAESFSITGSTTLYAGGYCNDDLYATVNPINTDYDIEWTSSDESIVTVTKNKKNSAEVKSGHVGTATITATLTDANGNVMTDTCIVTVEANSISDAIVSLDASSYTYTGSPIKPDVTVVYGSTTLTKNTDYTVSYSNNTNVGTATITITGIGDYNGTYTKTFKITTKSIANFTASLSSTSYTYDGTAKNPTVTVKDNNGKTLTSGTDYSVSYSNNTDVGTASVKITGKGNYTGTITKTFSINSISISKFTATLSTTYYTYDGNAKKPSVTVKDNNGKTLKNGTDYSVSYSNNTNAGTATVKITGKGIYSGTITKTFTIKAKSISNYTATLSKTSYTYTGSAIKPSVTLKNGSTTISSSNYTITYTNNKNVGTATVTITGKGNYSGSISKTFKITKRSLSNCTISLSSTSYTYNGSARKPTVTVKNGSTTISSSNYTVTYASGRKNVGTYKVTIKGKGNCSGTVTKTFKINAKNISSLSASLSTSTYTYDGKTKKPSVTLKNGSSTIGKSNYTVSYASGRKNVGSYKVTIKGKGNYTGTVTKTFKINPPKTSIKSLSKGEYAFTVTWTKKTTQVTGYQIQYSTSSSFSNATTKTISSNSTTSKKISSLKGNKKYYVRVRTYKTVSGTKYYSGWISSKNVTTNPSFDVSSLQVADETNKIIVVTASSTTTSSGTFRYFKKTNGTWKEIIYTTAYLGQNGINKTKEGDKKTPTGLYHFSKLMGIASNPGTLMSYTKITKYMYWCGSKKYYNQFIDESKQTHNCDHSNDEHLINCTNEYQYVAALDYNSSCTYGKGSAIFLHCTGNKKYTGGCIAISRNYMKQMMGEIDENTVIIIDLTSNITSKKY